MNKMQSGFDNKQAEISIIDKIEVRLMFHNK